MKKLIPLIITVIILSGIPNRINHAEEVIPPQGEKISPYLPQEIEELIKEVNNKDSKINEKALKSLHDTGTKGLSIILNVFLPDTAEILPDEINEEELKSLIISLGDECWGIREEATQKLITLGPGIRPAILEATRSTDPEVQFRARFILEKWKPNEKVMRKYTQGLRKFFEEIKDEERLDIVASKTLRALEAGMPSGVRCQILSQCLRVLVASERDEYSETLLPLLNHKDIEMVAFLVDEIGSTRDNCYFPPLLLKALQHPSAKVVNMVISDAPNCWDKKRAKELYALLCKIFEGDNEELKFQACFPLMHDYEDKKALSYLLTQTQSKDRKRALCAICWVGDACNSRTPVFPGLLENLVPLLKSPDEKIQFEAVDTLGTYSGESVVHNLIPFLGHRNSSLVSRTSRNLLEQPDKDMLRRLLSEAAQNHQNKSVRKKAQKLLDKMEQEGK